MPEEMLASPDTDFADEATTFEDTTTETAEVEDRYTDVDPNTLPPEHQDTYKRLQADYTRKRQADADARRQAETARQSAEAQLAQYQAIVQQIQPHWEDFRQYWQQRTTPVPTAPPPPTYESEAEQLIAETALKHTGAALTPMQEELQAVKQVLAQIVQNVQQMSLHQNVNTLQQTYQQQVQEAFALHGQDAVQAKANEIKELVMANPSLTVTQAFRLLDYPTARATGAGDVERSMEQKRRAGRIERPTGRTAPVPKEPTGPLSWEEIGRIAESRVSRGA